MILIDHAHLRSGGGGGDWGGGGWFSLGGVGGGGGGWHAVGQLTQKHVAAFSSIHCTPARRRLNSAFDRYNIRSVDGLCDECDE